MQPPHTNNMFLFSCTRPGGGGGGEGGGGGGGGGGGQHYCAFQVGCQATRCKVPHTIQYKSVYFVVKILCILDHRVLFRLAVHSTCKAQYKIQIT